MPTYPDRPVAEVSMALILNTKSEWARALFVTTSRWLVLFVIPNQDENAAHFFPRAELQYICV
jgi:hypothetical protein